MEIDLNELDDISSERVPSPAIVDYVEENSIGKEIGFEAGDQLISINGIKPRDLIDYRFLIGEEYLSLEVIDKKGKKHIINIEKEIDEELGLSFKDALFNGLRQCNNHCSFCFIDQQPKGHRKSLYLKDDDYRLSFLYGSYITLTNLKESDWQRIEEQRLSPLFVSVHATEDQLRARLLKNDLAIDLMNQLDWFSKRSLQIHAQVVICPGINDGPQLDKTLNDLATFGEGDWPTVISTAVVPVGLTRFRPLNDGLEPIDSDCAQVVISQVEAMQKTFKKNLGSNFAWLSDEWYLIGNKKLPNRNAYENFPQQENGVGSIRGFLEEMEKATSNLPKRIELKKHFSWVVGRLVENALTPLSARFNKVNGLRLDLYGLPSPYWGQDQVVTGLLTGEDLIRGLKGHNLGDTLLLPSVMLKEDQMVFLDDMTLEEIAKALQVPIQIVHGADDIVAAVLH